MEKLLRKFLIENLTEKQKRDIINVVDWNYEDVSIRENEEVALQVACDAFSLKELLNILDGKGFDEERKWENE